MKDLFQRLLKIMTPRYLQTIGHVDMCPKAVNHHVPRHADPWNALELLNPGIQDSKTVTPQDHRPPNQRKKDYKTVDHLGRGGGGQEYRTRRQEEND